MGYLQSVVKHNWSPYEILYVIIIIFVDKTRDGMIHQCIAVSIQLLMY